MEQVVCDKEPQIRPGYHPNPFLCVNLKRISSYTKGRIFLDNGEYIPLGENYKERFFEYFDNRL